MSTALIIHAIRNMFGRSGPKPKRPAARTDGPLGQQTRIALARYIAASDMPELPPLQFWDVRSIGGGTFRVELHEHAANGPRLKTGLIAPMADLSPETVVAMARTIMRATGGKR